MAIRRIQAGAATCLLLAACSVRRDESARGPGSVGRDARACAAPGIASLRPDSAAVRCAEWFLARNGYTQQPPADTGELVTESLEWAGSWRELLAQRANSLALPAVVLCRGETRGQAGYTVGFAAPGDTARRLGRAVTMNAAFRELRVQHVDFLLDAAQRDTACNPLAPISTRN